VKQINILGKVRDKGDGELKKTGELHKMYFLIRQITHQYDKDNNPTF